MTQREGERLAKMEQRQEDMAEDIREIKELLKAQDAKFAKFVNGANRSFLTRLEAKAYGAAITLIFSIVVIYLQLKDHLK